MSFLFACYGIISNIMRLFFALWPSATTQQQWLSSTDSLIKPLGGKQVPANNLHLTLHFLGEIDGSRTSTLQRMVDRLQPQDIILRFDKIECWRKADLACLRASHEPPALINLVNQLGKGLQQAGFTVEKRAFKAHVTLARRLQFCAEQLPVWPSLEWQADTLALVRSRLTPEGSIYTPVSEWQL